LPKWGQTSVNTLRRTLETLGLQRRQKVVGSTLGAALTEDWRKQQKQQQEEGELR
jgi:homoserine acetyltransferase